MVVVAQQGQTAREFAAFVRDVEPRLRQALVSTFGPIDGREATVDALSWAWEHWDRLATIDHAVAYLYRVGQSAVRRFATKPLPVDVDHRSDALPPEVSPELMASLARLPDQQRTVVVLVHGYGWSQAEVATLLDVGPSTVHEHLQRAMARLRTELEARE